MLVANVLTSINRYKSICFFGSRLESIGHFILISESSTDVLEIPDDAFTTLSQNLIGCSTQAQHSFKSTATSLMWKQLHTLTCPTYGNFAGNMNKTISGNRISGFFSWTSLMWRPIHGWYGQHSTFKLYLDIHLDMHINQLINTFVGSPPTFSHEFVIEAKLNGTFINLIVHIQVGALIYTVAWL